MNELGLSYTWTGSYNQRAERAEEERERGQEEGESKRKEGEKGEEG